MVVPRSHWILSLRIKPGLAKGTNNHFSFKRTTCEKHLSTASAASPPAAAAAASAATAVAAEAAAVAVATAAADHLAVNIVGALIVA
mmetsp:Transcript_33842/g.86138  ORF Transcript_33842/g.86138 Transcript_33842/m.86138 type:complete len:87 (+) Transcript_33842:151-411(+)